MCPFYSFVYSKSSHVMILCSGKCGVLEAFQPCKMKEEGNEPDFETCPVIQEAGKDQLLESRRKARVFPEELRPKGSNRDYHWDGVFFPDWKEYCENVPV